MAKTTEKIERLFAEVEAESRIEEAPTVIRDGINKLKVNMRQMVFGLKIFANLWLILFVLYLFLIYSTIVRQQYLNAAIDAVLFIFCLYQFVETSARIKIYGEGKIVLEVKNEMRKL